jgi:hypothetical protein
MGEWREIAKTGRAVAALNFGNSGSRICRIQGASWRVRGPFQRQKPRRRFPARVDQEPGTPRPRSAECVTRNAPEPRRPERGLYSRAPFRAGAGPSCSLSPVRRDRQTAAASFPKRFLSKFRSKKSDNFFGTCLKRFGRVARVHMRRLLSAGAFPFGTRAARCGQKTMPSLCADCSAQPPREGEGPAGGAGFPGGTRVVVPPLTDPAGVADPDDAPASWRGGGIMRENLEMGTSAPQILPSKGKTGAINRPPAEKRRRRVSKREVRAAQVPRDEGDVASRGSTMADQMNRPRASAKSEDFCKKS